MGKLRINQVCHTLQTRLGWGDVTASPSAATLLQVSPSHTSQLLHLGAQQAQGRGKRTVFSLMLHHVTASAHCTHFPPQHLPYASAWELSWHT